MAAAFDIQLGDGTGNAYGTGDLSFSNGDFAIGESDQQHVQDTITAFPGWWKQYPADGVGISSYVNASANFQALARNIQSQFTVDGYRVNPLPVIRFEDKQLKVYPNAVRI